MCACECVCVYKIMSSHFLYNFYPSPCPLLASFATGLPGKLRATKSSNRKKYKNTTNTKKRKRKRIAKEAGSVIEGRGGGGGQVVQVVDICMFEYTYICIRIKSDKFAGHCLLMLIKNLL